MTDSQHRSALLGKARGVVGNAQLERRDLTDEELAEVERLCSEAQALRGEPSDSDTKLLGEIDQGCVQRPIVRPRVDEFDPLGGVHDAQNGGGAVFQDPATGQTHRALLPIERFCSRPGADGQPHFVGRSLHAWLTGQIADRGPQSLQLGGSDTQGGYFLEPTLSGMVVDLARANSVCLKAGMQTIRMATNELHLVRVDSDPTPQWRPEGSSVTASGVTFGRIVMRSHTLAAVVPITLEMIEDAGNAPAIIEECVSSAIASEIDRVCLVGRGVGLSEPMGVRYAIGTNSVTVGAPIGYGKITEAVGEILADNYTDGLENLAWICHPVDGEAYASLTDTLGQPLQPGPWVAPLKKLYTTSCPQEEGSGTDSAMFVGDFRQMLLGVRRSGVVIRRIPAGTVTSSSGQSYNAVSQLLEHLVVHTRVDVAVMRPSWFCVLSGVVTS